MLYLPRSCLSKREWGFCLSARNCKAGVIQANRGKPGPAGLLAFTVMGDTGDNPFPGRLLYVRFHLHTAAA